MTARKDKRKGWMVDFILTWPNGESCRVRKRSPVQTKRGAEGFERQLREELLTAQSVPEQKKEVPTFEKFADEFMRTHVKNNNKPSVRADKESILRVHLNPAFGRKRLDAIGVRDIERFKGECLGHLNRKTVNNILAVLSRILNHAIEVEVLESRPKVRFLKLAPSKRDFLDFDEYDRLVAQLNSEPLWGSAILAAGEGGFRLGEVLGLMWEDVDLGAGVVTVRRALWREHLGSPKGGRERQVPMTRRLHDTMRHHRHLKGKFVWCGDGGQHLTKKMAQRALHRVCRRTGLREIGWHILRHTYCSHLAMRGAAPRAIQELAGHRSISTTMRYMHLAPTALREAVALLEDRHGTVHANGTILAPLNGQLANTAEL